MPVARAMSIRPETKLERPRLWTAGGRRTTEDRTPCPAQAISVFSVSIRPPPGMVSCSLSGSAKPPNLRRWDNLLVLDPGLTATIRQRQLGYLSQSTAVEAETVKARPFRTRLIGDVIGMASPLL